jgi:phosphopantothenoylcysteine decarboxylase/phosphopantothenate--cysteine ligase
MREAVLDASAEADALLMAAAVADYHPREIAGRKIKKGEEDLVLRLGRTTDILATVARQRDTIRRPQVVVGFAAEVADLAENARAKLDAKDLDLIVANDVTAPDAGFAVETNRVLLLDRSGAAEELPLMSKEAVARAVLDRVVRLLSAQD